MHFPVQKYKKMGYNTKKECKKNKKNKIRGVNNQKNIKNIKIPCRNWGRLLIC